MASPQTRAHRRTTETRNRRPGRASAALLGAALLILPGCEGESVQAFRDAASGSLQNGLKAIFDGLVDGAFAAFTPDASSSGDGS
jgi:hypothetical protein